MDHLETYLSQVREREAKATKGPWYSVEIVDDYHIHTGPRYDDACVLENNSDSDYAIGSAAKDNGDFIAAARTDIPKLLRIIDCFMESVTPTCRLDGHDTVEIYKKLSAILEDV